MVSVTFFLHPIIKFIIIVTLEWPVKCNMSFNFAVWTLVHIKSLCSSGISNTIFNFSG